MANSPPSLSMTLVATSARATPIETTVAATRTAQSEANRGHKLGEDGSPALAAKGATCRGREACRLNVLAHDRT